MKRYEIKIGKHIFYELYLDPEKEFRFEIERVIEKLGAIFKDKKVPVSRFIEETFIKVKDQELAMAEILKIQKRHDKTNRTILCFEEEGVDGSIKYVSLNLNKKNISFKEISDQDSVFEEKEDVLKKVLSLEKGIIIGIDEIIPDLSLDKNNGMSKFLKLVEWKILASVYKIKANVVIEPNGDIVNTTWTENIRDLNRDFNSLDMGLVSGKDLSNILIKFKKII